MQNLTKLKKSVSLCAVLLAFVLLSANSDSGCSDPTIVYIEAGKDNTIFSLEQGTKSNGVGSSFFTGTADVDLVPVGASQAKYRRALLWFDVANAVPSGATITDVTLQVYAIHQKIGPTMVTVHDVHRDWGEGDSNSDGGGGGGGGGGDDPEANDATWTHTFYDSQNWIIPGGDFTSQAITELNANLGPLEFPCTDDFITVVQDWLDNPSNNFGLLLAGDESTRATGRRYASRESTIIDATPNFSSRPTLKVSYTGP